MTNRYVLEAVGSSDHAPVPALVWDERHGWHTAAPLRHLIIRDAVLSSEDEGVRYLARGIPPPPGDVVAFPLSPCPDRSRT
ncbi:hypothetical protein ACIF6H_32485 [Streptomyces microflavus]|uniref:hypothetical protein n=1 Tax=Streptomyces microflavus TaxID=1919 RepID=UPI0037CDFBEF